MELSILHFQIDDLRRHTEMPIICEPRDSGLNSNRSIPWRYSKSTTAPSARTSKLMPWLRMRSEKHSSGKATMFDSADVQVRNLEVKVDVDFLLREVYPALSSYHAALFSRLKLPAQNLLKARLQPLFIPNCAQPLELYFQVLCTATGTSSSKSHRVSVTEKGKKQKLLAIPDGGRSECNTPCDDKADFMRFVERVTLELGRIFCTCMSICARDLSWSSLFSLSYPRKHSISKGWSEQQRRLSRDGTASQV